MQEIQQYILPSTLLFVRILLGIVFIFSGYDKIFKIGIGNVSMELKRQLQKTNIPDFVFITTATYSSIIEFTGGIMLILGLFIPLMGLALFLNLILVTIAMCIIEPLWDMRLIQLRVVLLLIVLFTPLEMNTFSIDYLLFMK